MSAVMNGERLSKAAPVFCVLGELDELNAWLGNLDGGLPAELREDLQREILALSGSVAGAGSYAAPVAMLARLEAEIDRLQPGLPKGFVLPRGPVHVARAVCRRAERALVSLVPDSPGIPLLNRLSDYLFVLAVSSV